VSIHPPQQDLEGIPTAVSDFQLHQQPTQYSSSTQNTINMVNQFLNQNKSHLPSVHQE